MNFGGLFIHSTHLLSEEENVLGTSLESISQLSLHLDVAR